MSSRDQALAIDSDDLRDAWQEALQLAWESFCAGTTPVGAVVVSADGTVVASGRGRRHEEHAPDGQLANSQIAHAEVNALAHLGTNRHWEDHYLLTTLEPCAMCHGAAIQSTVGTVFFAAPDPYAGTRSVQFDTPQSRRRALRIRGPLTDVRGALATVLHLVWLMGLPSATHVVAEHDRAMPALTEHARQVRDGIVHAAPGSDLAAAAELMADAPLEELV